MQKPTAKHEAELRESCWTEGKRFVRTKGIKAIIRKPTETINLDGVGGSSVFVLFSLFIKKKKTALA